MSNFSQFNGNGVYINDPTLLPRVVVVASNIIRGAVGSDEAAFWTGGVSSIDRFPGSVQDDTNWTADTYKTIASISGQSGIVSSFIGPTLPTAADTNTWRITVDGSTPYTATMTTGANASRCILGAATIGGNYDTVPVLFSAAGASPDGLTLYLVAAANIYVLSPYDPLCAAQPLLRYTTSLLVEAKISVSLSTTTARERRSGFIQRRTT